MKSVINPPRPEPTATACASVDPFAGFLLGMAVGDALGLPREGLPPQRAARIFGTAPLKHRLFCGRGMVSDDTEHMRMTALALIAQPHDPTRFARSLAWKLRWWLMTLPAGVGMATARSIIRLWLGWPSDRSGVWSAGNGPAMRAGILGLCLHRDDDPLEEFLRASTRITHTDPRAEIGAMLIARAVRETVRAKGRLVHSTQFFQGCREQPLDDEWLRTLEIVEQGIADGVSAQEFAAQLKCSRGISGYIVHTVAAVLFCWLRWPGEFRRPVEEIILLGGDADTTAAILGGLAGASCGPDAIPEEWLNRLIEWPYSVSWMKSVLSVELNRRWGEQRIPSTQTITSLKSRYWRGPAIVCRNLAFLGIVLMHGFRRLVPPY